MSVLALADARHFLNITTTATDAQLQSTIDAAEGAIVTECGPLLATTYTRRVRGGKDYLSLPVGPLLSLTSVTPVGTSSAALDVTKLNPGHAGTVELLTGGTFSAPFYDVVYSAGRNTTPPALLQAVREHTRRLWETQQGGTRRPGQGATALGGGAAFTPLTESLMGPYRLIGFA